MFQPIRPREKWSSDENILAVRNGAKYVVL
jgi:hypothetical protein